MRSRWCRYVHMMLSVRVEKKALMDETPSKDVYQQLECLAKQNPWFVQSLRSIMTQNILAEDHPAPAPAPAHTEPGPGADPSSHHAVLALLLAAYLKPSQVQRPPDSCLLSPCQLSAPTLTCVLCQGSAAASQLTGLLKQLEAGTSAVELLKHALVPGLAAAPPPDSGRGTGALLPSPGGGRGRGRGPRHLDILDDESGEPGQAGLATPDLRGDAQHQEPPADEHVVQCISGGTSPCELSQYSTFARVAGSHVQAPASQCRTREGRVTH